MAHFIGWIHGSRGKASRLGGKSSGMHSYAASWQGAVSVDLYEEDGIDYAIVRLCQHQGAGSNRVIYDGPVSGRLKEAEL